MRKAEIVALLIIATTLCGWGTISSGDSQLVTFTSDPPGADIQISGQRVGTTPISLRVLREKHQLVVLSKEGYKDHPIQLSTAFNRIVLLDFFPSPVLSTSLTTTDYATGATIKYSPSSYFVTLTPSVVSTLEKDALKRKMSVRSFIFSNYSRLTSDIARGDGEYLSNLYSSLNVGASDRQRVLAQLREMLFHHNGDVLAFEESIIDRLVPKT